MTGVRYEKKILTINQPLNQPHMYKPIHYYSNHDSPSRQHDPMKECNIFII